jgi:HSP20 family molecular chaperone IbpA
MKVSDTSTELKEYSKRLDDKLKKETVIKEKEISDIKSFYDIKKENTKTIGDENYSNQVAKNNQRLMSASHDYENKLNNYRDNLNSTKETVAKEEILLKSQQVNKNLEFKQQNQANMLEQLEIAKDNQEALITENNNNIHAIAESTRAEKSHLESTASSEINALSTGYNQTAVTNERNYRAVIDNENQKHLAEINIQKEGFKNSNQLSNEKFKRVESEKIKVQNSELTFLENHQKDMINQRQSDFKIRYGNIVKEHTEILDKLKNDFINDAKELTSKYSKEKSITSSRIDDNFYRVEKLNPTVIENEKELNISLEIPAHEKENVHLSAHGRGAKLTLTRKFTDSVKAEDDSINKSTRNELFSKEFKSQGILNSKLITQNYENGVLNFKIQKL